MLTIALMGTIMILGLNDIARELREIRKSIDAYTKEISKFEESRW